MKIFTSFIIAIVWVTSAHISDAKEPVELTAEFFTTNETQEDIGMLRIDDLNENQVLTITAGGKLTKDNYDRLLPELEQMLEKHGKLRFYIKLEDFSGFEIGALWEDIKFDYKYKNQYGKTAIIGNKKWEEWGTKISKIFFDSEMKFFYEDQKDEAWNWINS